MTVQFGMGHGVWPLQMEIYSFIMFLFSPKFLLPKLEYQTLEAYIKIFSLVIYLWLQKIKQCTYLDHLVNTIQYETIWLLFLVYCSIVYNLQTGFILLTNLVHLSLTCRRRCYMHSDMVIGWGSVSNCPIHLIFISRTWECTKITKFLTTVLWFLR